MLAPDVLFARLESQDVSASTLAVDGGADQPAGHAPQQRLLAGDKSEVRAAKGQRQSQRLSIADRQVGAIVPRGRQQPQ